MILLCLAKKSRDADHLQNFVYDKQANEDALKDGTRLLSCYRTPAGDRLYIISEHDRSLTTALLPEEY